MCPQARRPGKVAKVADEGSPEDRQRQVTSLRRKLRRIEREQDSIREEIGESLYTFATRAVERGRFPVVVSIEDEYCGGCHARLPGQLLAELRQGSVAQCDNCARIIYDADTAQPE